MTVRTAKLPIQSRGHVRVGRLLDAAAALIAERGVGMLTMAAVGQAAGSAPGSLYQFFPDRDALLEALARREAARVEAIVVEALDAWRRTDPCDAAGLAAALLPPLRAHYIAHPVWGELLHALSRRGAPGAVESALDAAVLVHLGAALGQLAPAASPARRAVAARVLLDLGHTGLLSAGEDDLMFGEVSRCLTMWLTAWQREQAAGS